MSSTYQSRTDPPRKLGDAQETLGLNAKNASLALLATAIGQIGEAIVITDAKGTIQYVNPAFTKMTGYSVEDALGQHTRLLKSVRQNPAYYQKLWQTILAGEVWHGELINRRKDGTHYTEDMSITPVRDPSGAITNFIAIKQDITTHRTTEAALQSSDKKLEEVQHITPLGSWELDAEAKEVRGSAGFFRILDCTPGTVVLLHNELLNAIPIGDRERVDKTLINTLQSGEPFDLEHRVVRRDGTTRVVRNRGQRVAAQGGKAARVVGTIHDITDYRLAHQKLRQSEEKFRSLVANIPDVTWSCAADGRTDYISPNVAQVLGFTPREICDHCAEHWFGRIHPTDAQRVADALQQLFTKGQPYDVEYRVQRKDSQWIWVHDRAYRTYEKDGISHADGIFSDITERKRVEEELRLAQFSLEHASDAVFWMDSEGRIVYVNQAACRSLGRPREELLSLSIPDIDPLFPIEAWGPFWKELKTRLSMSFETQHQTKQGQRVPVEITATYLEFDGKEYSFAFAHDITQRRRSEETIRQSERFLQSTLDGLSSHVAILDKKGEIVAVNGAWRRFTAANNGNQNACGVGSNYLEVCRRASRSSAEANSAADGIQQIMAGTMDQFSLEYPCHSPKQKRWFVLRVTPFADEGESRVVLAHENITNRKLAEEAVRESEARYRLLFERNLAGVFRTTIDGRILDCNGAAARIFGYDSPQPLRDLLITTVYDSPSDREAILSRLQSEKSLTNHEVRFRRRDGSSAWALANFTLVDRDSSAEETIEGSFIDITERKLAEDELYRSRQMLQTVLDAIPQRVFWKDRNSIYLGCNRAFATDYSVVASEIVGKSDLDFAWTEMADRYRADDKLVMEKGLAKLNFEQRQNRPDGSVLWLQTNKMPLRDREGTVTGVLGTYEDITERKSNEKELRLTQFSVEHAADAIEWMDAQARIVYVNQATCHSLGFFPRGVALPVDLGYRPAVPERTLGGALAGTQNAALPDF